LEFLDCTGCKWLIYRNVDYEQNIKILIKIQKLIASLTKKSDSKKKLIPQ
jgi:hypothetical protein